MLVVVASFVGVGVFAGGSAIAAESEFDPLAIVESNGLLQGSTQATAPAAADSITAPDLVDGDEASEAPSTIAPVEIVPVTGAEPVISRDAVVYEADDHGIVTGLGRSGTNAGFIVLHDASAPNTYSFTIDEDGGALVLNDDGTVTVLDATGNFVNYIERPWARDANNKELPTAYSVRGNTLTQTVSTDGAVFPVVADPTTGCGPGWCSIYFNRNETSAIAGGGPTAAGAISAGCLAVNAIIGGLCAVGFGISAAVAQGAYASGNCLGWFFTPIGNNPFVEPRGTSHCR